jgi:hypothetical protein
MAGKGELNTIEEMEETEGLPAVKSSDIPAIENSNIGDQRNSL